MVLASALSLLVAAGAGDVERPIVKPWVTIANAYHFVSASKGIAVDVGDKTGEHVFAMTKDGRLIKPGAEVPKGGRPLRLVPNGNLACWYPLGRPVRSTKGSDFDEILNPSFILDSNGTTLVHYASRWVVCRDSGYVDLGITSFAPSICCSKDGSQALIFDFGVRQLSTLITFKGSSISSRKDLSVEYPEGLSGIEGSDLVADKRGDLCCLCMARMAKIRNDIPTVKIDEKDWYGPVADRLGVVIAALDKQTLLFRPLLIVGAGPGPSSDPAPTPGGMGLLSMDEDGSNLLFVWSGAIYRIPITPNK